RAGHDDRSVPELRAVERTHVLQHELRRIAVRAVDVALDVEADAIVPLGQKPLGPAAEAAKQVDTEGPGHALFLPASRPASRAADGLARRGTTTCKYSRRPFRIRAWPCAIQPANRARNQGRACAERSIASSSASQTNRSSAARAMGSITSSSTAAKRSSRSRRASLARSRASAMACSKLGLMVPSQLARREDRARPVLTDPVRLRDSPSREPARRSRTESPRAQGTPRSSSEVPPAPT